MQPLVNAKPLHPHMCDAKMQLALVIALSDASSIIFPPLRTFHSETLILNIFITLVLYRRKTIGKGHEKWCLFWTYKKNS